MTSCLENCSTHSAHQRAIAQHDKRLDAHGDEIDNLRECVVRLTSLQESNAKWKDVAEERIAALEAAPSKRWDNLVNYVVTAIVALVIGMVAGQIGLN
jgi:hypothetical protein